MMNLDKNEKTDSFLNFACHIYRSKRLCLIKIQFGVL